MAFGEKVCFSVGQNGVQATTAIVEKTVRAFDSTIAVVITIAVVCCMERIIYLHHRLIISDVSGLQVI